MLLIWHTIIFQLQVAVKIFDDAITVLEIDDARNLLIVCNTYSEMKMFKI